MRGMKIRNASDIARTPLRKSACEIAEAGLQAIDTEQIVKSAVRADPDSIFVNSERFPLKKNGGIFVFDAWFGPAVLKNKFVDRIKTVFGASG